MILIVAAMQEELKDILNHPMKGIEVLCTGIGKVNAALHLSSFLAKNQVDAIYNLGFAGASSHYNVNDLVLIDQASYHDFDLTFFGYKKGQVPGFPESFMSSNTLLDKIVENIPEVKRSQLFTGDYFMTEAKDHPFVVDMEGAALYHVAHIHDVPIVSIKVISDILGMTDHRDNYKKFESQLGSIALLNVYLKLFGGS